MGNDLSNKDYLIQFEINVNSAINELKSKVNRLLDDQQREKEIRDKAVFDYIYSDQTPFPSLEIKTCPECGAKPNWLSYGSFVKCSNPNCILYDLVGIPVKDWNERRDGDQS